MSGMTLIFSILPSLIASVLYVIIYQKAGFRGAILALAAGPVLATLLSHYLFGLPFAFRAGLFLLPAALSLAPLAVLAFASWPPAATQREEDRS